MQEIWDLIESVSESFPTYFLILCLCYRTSFKAKLKSALKAINEEAVKLIRSDVDRLCAKVVTHNINSCYLFDLISFAISHKS